jgi:hypothetical protein
MPAIIQIEAAITLQLEACRITNPADQLRVFRQAGFLCPKKRPQLGGQAEAALGLCRAGENGTILIWVCDPPPPLTSAWEWPVWNLRVACFGQHPYPGAGLFRPLVAYFEKRGGQFDFAEIREPVFN